MPLSIHRLYKM